MSMKKAFLLLSLALGILSQAMAQNVSLVVTTTNGAEHTYQLTQESQLHFSNGESMVIEDGNGTVATFALAEIRKLVCSEVTGTEEDLASNLQILPNPSRSHFIVRNLSEACLGRIYTLDGRLAKEFEASEGSMVDISELAEGMYLLHINGQTLKLMKL